MRLDTAITEYLTARQGRGRVVRTVRTDKTALRVHLQTHVGNPSLNNITPAHIDTLFYGPQGLQALLAPSTFNIYRGRINGFFTWCVNRKYLKHTPMFDIERLKEPKKDQVRLTVDELVAGYDAAASPHDRLIWALGCGTGLRTSSMRSIRIAQVDLEAGYIRNVWYKGGGKLHEIPITSDLDDELRRWFTSYKQQTGVFRLPSTWFLMPGSQMSFAKSVNGERPASVQTLIPTRSYVTPERSVHRTLAALGLDEPGMGVHTLRRSAARALFDSRQDAGDARALHLTKEFLGHADVSMTQHYIGTSVERQLLNQHLRGKSFLTRPPSAEGTVTPFRTAAR